MSRRRLLPNLVLWLFPVVVVALVVLLLWGLYALSTTAFDGRGFGTMGRILVAPLVVALVLGIREARRFKADPASGIEILPAQHPELWAEVQQLAHLAQTAPPSRIVIVPEVNAAVTEAAGQRELLIGLPLLATFTRAELRSVLAHELGHFAGGDTAASAAIARRVVLLYRVRDRASWLWRWFFTAYAGLYARAAGPAARDAELRADDLSVLVAGAAATATALRAVERTAIAWDLVMDRYLPLFSLAGRRASLGEAVWRISQVNADALERATDAALTARQPSATDTHPPMRDRIARISQLHGAPATPPPDSARPAVDLLSGGARWLTAAEGQLLAEDRPLASWDEVITLGVTQSAALDAARVGAWVRAEQLGDGGLNSILALLDDPSGGGPVHRLTGGVGPQARAEAASLLMDPIVSALLAGGAAVVEPSWTGSARIVEPDGTELTAAARIEQALDTGSSAPLRSWLTGLGVDLATTRAVADVPQWLAALSQMTGPWEGRRDVHLWSTGVLALPPLGKATIKENKQQVAEKHQHPRLYQAAAQGLEAGRRLPGALWWDAGAIVGGEISGRMKIRLRFNLVDGTSLEMSATLETATVDSPADVGAAVNYLTAPGTPTLPTAPASYGP